MSFNWTHTGQLRFWSFVFHEEPNIRSPCVSQSSESARSLNMVWPCLHGDNRQTSIARCWLHRRSWLWFIKPYQLFGRILLVHKQSLQNDTLDNPILGGKLVHTWRWSLAYRRQSNVRFTPYPYSKICTPGANGGILLSFPFQNLTESISFSMYVRISYTLLSGSHSQRGQKRASELSCVVLP